MSRSMKTRHLRKHALPLCAVLILASAAAAALSSCFFDTKTTLCEASGLRCRPGQTCAADQAACIAPGGCADGIRNGLEVCDDGNVNDGDGCSHDCMSDETCGNAVVDEVKDERCDPAVPGTTNCSDECKLQVCGNRILDPDEACDDGNKVPGDGCNADCLSKEVCGNGIQDLGEQCEFNDAPYPMKPTDTLVCDDDCSLRRCGDGHVNKALDQANRRIEDCDEDGADTKNCNGNKDPRGAGYCKFPRCGDGYVNPLFKPAGPNKPAETCDGGGNTAQCNGNDHDHDGIDDTMENDVSDKNCQMSVCGDGYINFPTEECDDANSNNTDACTSKPGAMCKTAFCGDGFRQLEPTNEKEICDPTAPNPNAPCGAGRCNDACACM
jgi:cysteine-rich repeat protein